MSLRKRQTIIVPKVSLVLNLALLLLGTFILIAMSVVWLIFEEFTAFTDYTQDWIEFNFFIHYWDKLVITRTYLSFMFIYGAAILAIAAMQIHGLRKRDRLYLHYAPLLLIIVAIITFLGAIAWLIVTSVNFNQGFLANSGFIFDKMRFKGNVWKDLKYREESFKLVANRQVSKKAIVLDRWVHQRERDFDCCGWNGYLDYKNGGNNDLPESCCKRKHRRFQCGADFLSKDINSMINTRGCNSVMYAWYRQGFVVNLIMASIGLLIAAYEFFLFSINKKQYTRFMNDLHDKSREKFQKIYKAVSSKQMNDLTQVLLPKHVSKTNGSNISSGSSGNESQYSSYSHLYMNDMNTNDEKMNLKNYTYNKDKVVPATVPRSIIPIKNRFKQLKMSESQSDFDEENEDNLS